MTDPDKLEYILANLLWSRIKAEDNPCASDQHWCSAIEELVKLIPDHQLTHPEFMPILAKLYF
jgi:hypothetical protein